MSNEERMDEMERKLDKLLDSLNGASPRSSRRHREEEEDDDRPRSARDVGRGRRGRDPLEIQGVLFQVRVPVGRHGDTMSGYLLFPPVKDERELEELADDVERDFRLVKVWSPQQRGQNGNGFQGNGYNRDRDRGYRNYGDRDRGYNRDYGRRW